MRRRGSCRRAVALALAAAVLPTAAAAAATRSFVIDGRGFGHGVGMSQWGAEGLALHGVGYQRILSHYYPGTVLRREASARIRVLLATGAKAIRITSGRRIVVVDGGGRRFVVPRGRALQVRPSFRRPLPLRVESGGAPLVVRGRGYRGLLLVEGAPGALDVVNALRLEDYVRGVVPWEMPFYWRPAALQAQAVAARTYALAERKPGQRFDVFPDTRDQMYGGVEAERPSTDAAVAATRGQVLTWHGSPALTYFFSTSGGRTAAAPDGIPGAPARPYLVSVSDPYDSLSPRHTWGPLRFAPRTLAKRLRLPGVVGLTIRRNGSERVASVVVRWRVGETTLSGRTFATRLDLPSTWFAVDGAGVRSVGGGRGAGTAAGGWPAGRSGWTVVLAALPASGGVARARAEAAAARRAGLAAGVLATDDFPGLRAGYEVVFSGVYGTAAAAERARTEAARRYPAAYVRRIEAP